MKIPILPAVLLLVSSALPAAEPARAVPARNPLLWADVPDVSAIRVGETYYMSSTTMHLSPGLPIMKSTDLVNWNLVGYAYQTLADTDALRLEGGRNAYGAGSWASSLRHHDGRYYVSTFSATSRKTHIFSTRDIEHGPWTESAFSPSLHDHSLFFDDDGRVYMVYGSGEIRLVELKPDLSGLLPGGVNQVIIANAGAVAPGTPGLPAEGSQLFKVNGRYYLFNITWPKGGMRTQLVHRADTLTGPYEGRVALQDQGVAQGGLLETADGRWYAFLFKDHGAVGRVPHLVPVEWRDGWPVLGTEGRVPELLDLPPRREPFGNLVTSDGFAREAGAAPFPLAWQWNHNPDDRFWSLSERPGYLRLTAGRIDASLTEARNVLTQRTFGPVCSAHVALDVSGLKPGDVAGLAAFQKRYGFVGVKQGDGVRSLVVVTAEDGDPAERAVLPLEASVVHLRIDCDFRDQRDVATFHVSLDGERWEQLGGPLQMTYTLPHFMGYRFGLFHFATRETGGRADFDFYQLSPSRRD